METPIYTVKERETLTKNDAVTLSGKVPADVRDTILSNQELISRICYERLIPKVDNWIFPAITPEQEKQYDLERIQFNKWYRKLWRSVSRLKSLRVVFIDNYTHNNAIESY